MFFVSFAGIYIRIFILVCKNWEGQTKKNSFIRLTTYKSNSLSTRPSFYLFTMLSQSAQQAAAVAAALGVSEAEAQRRLSTRHAGCSAPGKAILFGEHAVVYGHAALASALSDLRLFVDGSIEFAEGPGASSFDLQFLDILDHEGKPFHASLNLADTDFVKEMAKTAAGEAGCSPFVPLKPSAEVLAALKERVMTHHNAVVSQGLASVSYLLHCILPELVAYEEHKWVASFKIKSVGLPIGAGLGSSAAFSVALAGCLFNLRYKLNLPAEPSRGAEDRTHGHSLDTLKQMFASADESTGLSPLPEQLQIINGWAYCAEVIIHGQPSGLDNTTSCLGGTIKYDKVSGKFEPVENFPPFRIVLTNTRVPRSTSQLVGKVRELSTQFPEVVTTTMTSIGNITKAFLALIEDYNAKKITYQDLLVATGKLFSINHHLLCALGVGHAAIDAVVAESAKQAAAEAAAGHNFSTKLTGAGGGGCTITQVPFECPEGLVSDLKERLR